MRLPRALWALVAVPVALPLAVLAASPGRLVAGLPAYRYQALPGDAYGYYSCVREILSAASRNAPAAAVVVAVALGLAWVARRSVGIRRVLALDAAVAAVAAFLAHVVGFTGAAQFGWPLLWAVPIAPLRVVGAVDPTSAFAVGLAVSIVANAVTVVAAWFLARNAGLSSRVAVAGSALVALWPLLSLLAGHDAATNGTWQIWLGLSLYTEPVSTALVTVALALAARERLKPPTAALAGGLLGYATLVRDSNVLVLGVILVVLWALRRRTSALAVAAGAAVWAPAVLLYWPKGYPRLGPPTYPAHPFELRYVLHAWGSSSLWRPAVLAVLLPLALLGAAAARRRVSLLVWPAVVVTGVFYSFYAETPIHPRFLFAVLPAVLVYWAAGATALVGLAHGAPALRLYRPRG